MALPVRFYFKKNNSSNKMNGWLALSPLFVFIAIFLASSIYAHSFYVISISVPFVFASVYAVIITRRYETTSRIVSIFSEGAGNQNILLMVWIIILAAAFSQTCKQIGAIDAVANMALRYLPGNLLYVGLFIVSAIISMAIGTNIGTIIALVPIVVGIGENAGLNVPLMTAIIVGGGTFGDNMSFISDTTIAATTSLGCDMKDKFKANIGIAGPAALIAVGLYFFLGSEVKSMPTSEEIHWIMLLPYAVTIILAMIGVNVVTVLTFGVLLNGVLGIICGNYDAIGWMIAISDGIKGLNEMIVIMMLAGGMLELVRYNGGIDFIVNGISNRIKSKRATELGLATLVSFVTCCTANNTIAILTTGKIAREVSQQNGINPIKTASILDTFSCVVQSLLPYGMHLLMASAMAHTGTLGIIKYLYYPPILAVIATLAIILKFPRKYS